MRRTVRTTAGARPFLKYAALATSLKCAWEHGFASSRSMASARPAVVSFPSCPRTPQPASSPPPAAALARGCGTQHLVCHHFQTTASTNSTKALGLTRVWKGTPREVSALVMEGPTTRVRWSTAMRESAIPCCLCHNAAV